MFDKLKEFWAKNIAKNYKKISIGLSNLFIGGLTALITFLTMFAGELDPAFTTVLVTFFVTIQASVNTIVQSIFGKVKDGNGYHKDGFLIIDNDEIAGALLCRGLRKEGFECEFVKDVDSGFAAVYRKDYDVLIIDGSVADSVRGRTIEELIHSFRYADEYLKTLLIIKPDRYNEDKTKYLLSLSNKKGINVLFKPFELEDIINLIEDTSCWT